MLYNMTISVSIYHMVGCGGVGGEGPRGYPGAVGQSQVGEAVC
jgi:hypothetical protein